MIKFFKGKPGKKMFDRKVLRKNNISLLILDERWNKLFDNADKTSEIKRCEQDITKLLKEEAALTSESKQIPKLKKKYMDKIISLTEQVYEKGNEDAKKQMGEAQKEITKLNKRIDEVNNRLEEIPDEIREINLELLENTVNSVYFRIRKNEKRAKELDKIIEETRIKLKEYIDERGTLAEDYTGVYSYFHNLLGGEELERLDREFFEKGKS